MKLFYFLLPLAIWCNITVNGQNRCHPAEYSIYVVAEEMPQLNIPINNLEEILANSIDINKYPRPINDVIYISFIINSKGEDFAYKAMRPIDTKLEKELITILHSNTTWSPAKNKGKKVNFKNTFEIRINGDRFNIIDKKEKRKLLRKNKKRSHPSKL
jgi:hypothetical protein